MSKNNHWSISINHQSILSSLVLILAMAAIASATIVPRMELPELVQKADSIVQGQVQHTEVRWENNLAFTYVWLNVADPMKGERRSEVVIKQIGGKIGAMNVTVAGMPKFAQGEDVIVFLKDSKDGTFQVLGMNQGKYAIDNDFAISNVSGIDVLNPRTGRIETPAFIDKAPVETLKSKIRELLK
jgi:hypothetical protein